MLYWIGVGILIWVGVKIAPTVIGHALVLLETLWWLLVALLVALLGVLWWLLRVAWYVVLPMGMLALMGLVAGAAIPFLWNLVTGSSHLVDKVVERLASLGFIGGLWLSVLALPELWKNFRGASNTEP